MLRALAPPQAATWLSARSPQFLERHIDRRGACVLMDFHHGSGRDVVRHARSLAQFSTAGYLHIQDASAAVTDGRLNRPGPVQTAMILERSEMGSRCHTAVSVDDADSRWSSTGIPR